MNFENKTYLTSPSVRQKSYFPKSERPLSLVSHLKWTETPCHFPNVGGEPFFPPFLFLLLFSFITSCWLCLFSFNLPLTEECYWHLLLSSAPFVSLKNQILKPVYMYEVAKSLAIIFKPWKFKSQGEATGFCPIERKCIEHNLILR